MEHFDAWPLIPLRNKQLASVSSRRSVLIMPPLRGADLLDVLIKIGCLIADEEFVGNDLFCYQACNDEAFVEVLIDCLGKVETRSAQLSVNEAEQLLRFFNEEGQQASDDEPFKFNDAQKRTLQALPVFETFSENKFVALDAGDLARFTFQPSLCGGLFEPTDDDRFLKYKEEFANLYKCLGVQLLSEADILGRFLLPTIDSAGQGDKNDQIQYVRRHWDRSLKKNQEFVDRMKQVSFVTVADGRTARAEELFSPSHPILGKIFQGDPVFPSGEFTEPDWLDILKTLGLREELDPPLFLQCARRVQRSFQATDGAPLAGADLNRMLEGAESLAQYFTRSCNQLATADNFCRELTDIRFLPVPAVGVDTERSSSMDADEMPPSLRTASYSEVSIPRDWALVWCSRPICPAALLPPQLFWSKLGIKTPPPIEHVLEHLRSIPSDVLERWSFPQSREAAFQRVFEYLADRVDRLPQQQLQQLQNTACVPVSNHMVRPSRLFFHLSDELAPFLFEVPREFGVYDELFRTLGVRDKTDHARYLVELLAELREEFSGAALNASDRQHRRAGCSALICCVGEEY